MQQLIVNISISNYTECPWYYFTQVLHNPSFIKTAIGTMIGLIGLITNTILLLTILMVGKLRKSSRTLASLSVCGIIFNAAFVLPIHLLPLHQSIQYFVSYYLLGGRLAMLLLVNINLHQCVLGIERWLAVASPLRYRRYRKSKLVHLTCILLWITSLALISLPLAIRYIMTTSNRHLSINKFNSLNGTAEQIEKICIQVIMSTTYILLFIIIISSYTSILARVNSSHRKSLFVYSKVKSKYITSVKTIRQMIVVTGTFLILCSPALIVIMSPMIGKIYITGYNFTVISYYFLISYPSVNPILYYYYGRNVRKEIYSAALTRSVRSFNDSKIRDRTTS